jgi:hypothetical protein
MFADGSLGVGGPYDGIITINALQPVQFTRPVAAGNFDAQMFTEHEIDEVLGWDLTLAARPRSFLAPQDLFSWSSLNVRNTSSSGLRFFSIDKDFMTSLSLTRTRPATLGTGTATPFARHSPVCAECL